MIFRTAVPFVCLLGAWDPTVCARPLPLALGTIKFLSLLAPIEHSDCFFFFFQRGSLGLVSPSKFLEISLALTDL